MPLVGRAAAAGAASSGDYHDRRAYQGRGSHDLGVVPVAVASPHSSAAVASPRVHRLEKDLMDELSMKERMQDVLTDHSSHWLVESVAFKGIVTFLVLINSILMGVEVDYPEWKDGWNICGHCFSAAFMLEFFIKLVALRCDYFCDRWNLLDCVLAIMGFMDTWFVTIVGGSDSGLKKVSVLRTLRLLRLMRLARLFRQFSKLVIVLKSIKDAIESTFWVALILTMCIYVCAIFCVDLIGHAPEGLYPGKAEVDVDIDRQEVIKNFNPYVVFGSMSAAMVSLFNVAILAEWTEIVRPVMLKQPPLVLFFIAFSIFVCFGVMNVIIGMIVDSVIQNARALERELEETRRREKVEILQDLKKMIFHVDTDAGTSGDYTLDMDELERVLQGGDEVVDIVMQKLSLPYGCSAEEFKALLDNNGNGKVEHDEFVHSLYRLISCGPFQQTCLLQIGVNKLLRHVTEFSAATNSQVAALDVEIRRISKHLGLQPHSQHTDLPDAGDASEDHASLHHAPTPLQRISQYSPRPALSRHLEGMCHEVATAVLPKIRDELAAGIEKALAISKDVVAEPAEQQEIIEDQPQKLTGKASGFHISNNGARDLEKGFCPINAPVELDELIDLARVAKTVLPLQAEQNGGFNKDKPDCTTLER